MSEGSLSTPQKHTMGCWVNCEVVKITETLFTETTSLALVTSPVEVVGCGSIGPNQLEKFVLTKHVTMALKSSFDFLPFQLRIRRCIPACLPPASLATSKNIFSKLLCHQ